MGYLENFARNQKTKGKTEVLTARIPADLYKDFKTYCDDLGLKISEAVYLLVQREMDSLEKPVYTESTTNESEPTTSVSEPTTKRIPMYTKPYTDQFTTKQWQVNGKLPCPICGKWSSASNYNRHARDNHKSSTYEIFTNEANLQIVNEMIKKRGEKQ